VTVPALRDALIVAGMVFSVGALAGCGHDRSAGPPAAPVAAVAGQTQRQLERALLTEDELPLGFERQDGGGDATAIGCPGIDRLYLARGTTARATVSFGQATSAGFVNETIAVQPGEAAANVDGLRRSAQDCRAFSGAGEVRYQVFTLDGLPSHGDATAAVRVTSRLREARPVDLVAVRLGDTVVLIAHADAGAVDTELTRTIVARAVEKARRAG
jgi:hypothetical protein